MSFENLSSAPPEMDLSWVTPHLAVGGCFALDELPSLCEIGVSHIVDVRLEERDDEAVLRRHGVTLLHLPTVDHEGVSQQMLDDGVAWVNRALDAGKKVYIHCRYGIGRSALLTLCVLVSRGHAPLEALRVLKDAREVVSPSPEQFDAFREWCVRHHVEPPTMRELGAISYRHLTVLETG